jgi:hypothetical protein
MESGSTDLVIIKTIKGNQVLKDRKVVRFPHYIPIPDPKNPPQYLVFGDFENGAPNFVRGIECTHVTIDYLQGLLAIENKDREDLLRYCFDNIEHEDRAIADDAFAEFTNASDAELNKAGRTLSADKLRKWLQEERTPPRRLPLYAFLLAITGNEKDAELMPKLIERLKEGNVLSEMHRVLIAYVRLSPKNGWRHVCELLEKPEMEFLLRYGGFKAVKYFHETQPEILTQKEILAAISLTLKHSSFADLPIEYLRQCKCWDLTEQILSLAGKKEFDLPINQRSILRYALQCPDVQASRFVASMRKSDPSRVQAAEDYLRSLESSPDNKPRSEQR